MIILYCYLDNCFIAMPSFHNWTAGNSVYSCILCSIETLNLVDFSAVSCGISRNILQNFLHKTVDPRYQYIIIIVLLPATLLLHCPTSVLSVSAPTELDNRGLGPEVAMSLTAVSMKPPAQSGKSKLVSAVKVTAVIFCLCHTWFSVL